MCIGPLELVLIPAVFDSDRGAFSDPEFLDNENFCSKRLFLFPTNYLYRDRQTAVALAGVVCYLKL